MRIPTVVAMILFFLAPSPTWGQATLPAHKWSHCTTLTGSGGVATGSDHTGAMVGGAVGWEITPRVGLEGSATWFDKQPGSTAFAAGLSVRAILLESYWLAPYVEGGFGLYSASFDPKRATDIPSFYGDRMSGLITNWFTDPAFFAGVGFDLMRRNNFAMRPTFGAIVAVRDGQAYTVGTLGVRVEYHFGGLPPAPFR